MGRPELENLAIKLSNELNGLANVIPGILNLNVYFLETIEDKIRLQLKSNDFLDMFYAVDNISQLESGNYEVKVKIGDLAFISVLDATEIKKYVSAETTASTRPGPVLCGELESARRAPAAR